MVKNVIGINLGTTQSYGCYSKGLNERGRIKFHEVLNESARKGMIREDNEKYFPSYVLYDCNQGHILAGEKAKLLAYCYPKTTVYEFKRLIGRRFDDPEVQKFKKILGERGHYELCNGDEGEVKIKICNNKKISPEEVSSEIIIEIVKNAFQQEPNLEIDRMVISVPAYFNLVHKKKTKEAAILAIQKLNIYYPGRIQAEDIIKDIELISEPTAAFITYKARGGLEGMTGKEYVLVFDLGATTHDITIGTCKVITDPLGNEDVLLDIKAIYGNNVLGGRDIDGDIDEKIMEWVICELQKNNKAVDVDKGMMMYEIGEQVRLVIIRLLKKESTTINLLDLGIEIPINRAKLLEIIYPIAKRYEKEIKNVMEKYGVKKGDIKRIVMTGDFLPKYLSLIRKAVEEEVGTKITELSGWNPETCVAEGAARSGHFRLQFERNLFMS